MLHTEIYEGENDEEQNLLVFNFTPGCILESSLAS